MRHNLAPKANESIAPVTAHPTMPVTVIFYKKSWTAEPEAETMMRAIVDSPALEIDDMQISPGQITVRDGMAHRPAVVFVLTKDNVSSQARTQHLIQGAIKDARKKDYCVAVIGTPEMCKMLRESRSLVNVEIL